jgi:3-oxoacyl-[acyl-carrier protein] reductase
MARRLALLTGGCSGIGLAAAQRLAVDHDLALSYASNHDRAEAALTSIRALGFDGSARVFSGRLRSHDDVRELLDRVRHECGRAPDVLVNSVGGTSDGLFIGSEFSDHHDLVQEHLIVPMALAHTVALDMYKARFGRIVNIGSISASYAKRGQVSYAAAKAGVVGFSRTLALEVAHRGVTVNVVAPGLIATPLTHDFIEQLATRPRGVTGAIPTGCVGTPGDVAGMIAFLCSQQARYITGAVITVDGGRSLGDTTS